MIICQKEIKEIIITGADGELLATITDEEIIQHVEVTVELIEK
ncbi:hypothetical protein ACI1PU_002798 [Listeria monocytogenes]|uniref:Uncharacterized protein n=1 Tax=Listeria phage vB_LmoS_293 TaxID=1591073 RepID=A0A0B5CU59_9CAUD|nr:MULTISPECIES: hypothetical protein [Listeria]YP_009210519.1 hypothetical protein AVV21_gp71 [Listeria phage vB_LmoS_293]AJE28136.1 hypothetical protein SE25_071 [Listeria phage vB_LmoS_293]